MQMEVLEKKPEASAPVQRTIVLAEARLGLSEHRRQDWVVDAAEGTAVSDLSNPAYWAFVAGKFNPFDRVEVRVETGDWVAELIVVDVGRNWARMHLTAMHDLSTAARAAPANAILHKVEYKGPYKKHCVIRLSDSMMIQEGIATKLEAEAWLANHERVTG